MAGTITRQIISGAVICICSAAISYGIVYYNQKKIVVVDAIQLFNGYNMKKELEARAGARLKYLGSGLDSLERQIKMTPTGNTQYPILVEQYKQLQQSINYEYTQSNQQINEMVWRRLNPIVEKYGKAKGLRLIVGATGTGNVLYYDGYYDRTTELIDYVNKDYENSK